ncbi:MAG: hypothetical protein AAFQ85_05970 [Pseudomonadota bacterium]
MKALFAAGFICSGLALATGALAQTFKSADDELVRVLDEKSIGSILSEAGASWRVSSRDGSGAILIEAEIDGLQVFIETQSCDPTGCTSLSVRHVTADTVDAGELNDFALDQQFVSAGTYDDGRAWLLRYVFAEFGIPRGNLKAEIANLVGLVKNFLADGAPGTAVVADVNYSADDLNSRQSTAHTVSPMGQFARYQTISARDAESDARVVFSSVISHAAHDAKKE